MVLREQRTRRARHTATAAPRRVPRRPTTTHSHVTGSIASPAPASRTHLNMRDTRNSILRISDEKTIELIELYRQEECLWNTTLEDYKNKDKRMKAYQKIAKTLNIPNFEAKHVTIKFKNLRNSYSQELKKIAMFQNNGDEEYRPKVFWFSTMDSFIRPHLQPHRSSASASVYDIMVYHSESGAETVTPDDTGTRNTVTRNECDAAEVCHTELMILPDKNSLSDHNTSDDDNTCYRNKRKSSISNDSVKRIKVESEDRDEEQQTSTVSDMNHTAIPYGDDIYDNFGRYVAALLRSLPSNKSISLQPKIINMITESMTNKDKD